MTWATLSVVVLIDSDVGWLCAIPCERCDKGRVVMAAHASLRIIVQALPLPPFSPPTL